MAHLCGCYYMLPSPASSSYPVKHYLPRLDLSVHTTILSTTSRTNLTQTYVNPSSEEPVKECVYEFPLYDGVSVVGFTCRIGSRIIQGVVKEKEKARAVYKEAVERGETAGLLEQLSNSDVFQTRIGNIPAGEKVIVDISYVGELKHDAETDGIRFTIPTKIAPRYGDSSLQSWPRGGAGADDSAGIRITVDARLAEGSFIRGIQSPTHPIAVTMGSTSTGMQEEPQMHRASATLTLGSAELDKDFVLVLLAKDTATPKALLETHSSIPHQRALMVTLVPKFALPPSRPEIIFVVDRSGSMADKIPTLKSALRVFLKSLPIGVKFNICSFGSEHSFLWPKSQAYSQSTLTDAMRHVDSLDANLGGTETFAAIKATIESRYQDIPLEVMLLTDGEIWNQEQLFAYLNKEVGESEAPIRVFSLGIGNAISHALIEGIARAGNGFAQTVGENEKLDSKVVRMLKGGLSPHITNYTLEVKYEKDEDKEEDFELVERVTDGLRVLLNEKPAERDVVDAKTEPLSLFDTNADPDKEDTPMPDVDGQCRYDHLPTIPIPNLLQAPQRIPPLFPFNRTTVYLLMGPHSSQKTPKTVVLRATSPHGPLELEIPVQATSEPGETIHQLAAKKAVGDLEEGRGWIFDARDENGTLIKERFESRFDEMVEREAVRLGVKFQVGGKWCSFVAVEDVDQKENQTRASEVNTHQGVDASRGAGPACKSNTTRFGVRRKMKEESLGISPIKSKRVLQADRSLVASARMSVPPSCLAPSAPYTNVAVAPLAMSASPRAKKAKHDSSAAMMSIAPRTGFNNQFAASKSPSPASYPRKSQPPPTVQIATDVSGGYEDLDAEEADEEIDYSEDDTAPVVAPPAIVPPEVDDLDQIIALQTFEGWWKLDDALLKILKLSRREAEKIIPGNVGLEVWGTVLAICFLEERLPDRKDAWELVVEKARWWLDGPVKPDEVSSILFGVARGLLGCSVDLSDVRDRDDSEI